MRISGLILVNLLVVATSVDGGKWFQQRPAWFRKLRGGSSGGYPAGPNSYNSGGSNPQYDAPPPEFPPDLPPQYGDDEVDSYPGPPDRRSQQQPQHGSNNDPHQQGPSPSYGMNEQQQRRASQQYHDNGNHDNNNNGNNINDGYGPPPPPPGMDAPPLPPYGDQQQQHPNYPDNDDLLPPDHNQMNYEQQYDDISQMDDTTTTPPDMDMKHFDKEYILKGLAKLYKKKILPLEKSSKYGHFHSPPLSPSDFIASPMVLLLGQYSVGKTSFIRYLIGRDFPGIRVGPEPTTDRFTSVLWGSSDKIVPGAALVSQTDRPFTGLSPFGNNFLSRLEGVELDSAILKNITMVDTPGILSGQKQRSRNYDYDSVMKWFGERADLVIIMFDANKLDISDELKRVMELFIPHLDKVRIVLNKADSISTQQLMRVYGALMWSLGKVMNTPEVCRVYMGSFWDAPLHCSEQAELLQQEEMDLLQDIMRLPQQAVMRRINELVKRARSVKVHAYIIHYLRKQLPYTWGKREKQKRLIGRLESEFKAAARRYGLPTGDFPPIGPFRQALMEIKDLSEFPKLDKKLVKEMDKVFSVDIPDLLEKAKNH